MLRTRIEVFCDQVLLIKAESEHIDDLKALAKRTMRSLDGPTWGSKAREDYDKSRELKKRNAIKAGVNAHEKGISRDDCPYKGGGYWGWCRERWLEGWDQAQKEKESKE